MKNDFQIAEPRNVCLAVIIPAYQGGDQLVRAIESLSLISDLKFHVIVIDNASTDGSVAAASQKMPEIHVLRNEVNLGFGAACNQGIFKAMEWGAELLLVLNQDTIVPPDLLERLMACAKEKPRAGIIGPKTFSTCLMADGRPQLLYEGAWRRGLPLGQFIPGTGQAGLGKATVPLLVDYVYGHAMLLRSSALRDVGVFDSAYFMYHEDVDLCVRMKDAGWEIWCDPRAIVWHDIKDLARGENSEAWRWKCKVQSARIFHRKRHSRPVAELLTLAYVFGEAVGRIRSGQGRAAVHVLQAWQTRRLPFSQLVPER